MDSQLESAFGDDSRREARHLNGFAIWSGALLLAVAPLVRGGNRQVALIALEWLALAVLLALAWGWFPPGPGWPVRRRPRWPVALLVLAPLWMGLWQLFPLPADWVARLPGREAYMAAAAAVQTQVPVSRPLSLTPDATWASLLAALPIVAAFLLAHLAGQRQIQKILNLLVVMAVVQSVWGLLQLAYPWLYFDVRTYGHPRPVGSFANANHFANFLVMMMPWAVLRIRQPDWSAPHTRRRLALRLEEARHWAWWMALFILWAGVLASLSRGALASGLVATALAWVLAADRSERGRTPLRLRLQWLAVAGLLALALLAVGLDGVLRFVGSRAQGDSSFRWQLTVTTWRGAQDFFPFGSGWGSYEAVYPRFQPLGLPGFAEHAHNDYVQFLMEGGLLAVLLAAGLLVLVVMKVLRLRVALLSAGGVSERYQAQLVCGVGVLALAIHSWVDFNLRIPANAMMGAFLLGAFLRELPARRSVPSKALT